MRTLTLLLAALPAAWLAAAAPAVAQDEPADETIIRELIAVTGAEKLLDNVYAQVDAMMAQSMAEAVGGKIVSPQQQALFDEMRERIVAIFRESMNWATFEPLMIDIYRKSFTRKEAQGMLDFYRTDAGRAVIAKMPLVMQHSVAAMQANMRTMMPKIQEVQQDIIARLRALDAQAAPPS
jgi:uncharacterized protein